MARNYIEILEKENLRLMKVKYLGETKSFFLTHGKVYEVLSVEKGWYRIIDDTNDDYRYPPEDFEIIEAKACFFKHPAKARGFL